MLIEEIGSLSRNDIQNALYLAAREADSLVQNSRSLDEVFNVIIETIPKWEKWINAVSPACLLSSVFIQGFVCGWCASQLHAAKREISEKEI